MNLKQKYYDRKGFKREESLVTLKKNLTIKETDRILVFDTNERYLIKRDVSDIQLENNLYAHLITACPYRVGDILTTTIAGNPSEYWLGTTWEGIKDTILRATNVNEATKITKGSDNRTLIKDNLPEFQLESKKIKITLKPHSHKVGGYTDSRWGRAPSTQIGGGEQFKDGRGGNLWQLMTEETSIESEDITLDFEKIGKGKEFSILPKCFTVNYWIRIS